MRIASWLIILFASAALAASPDRPARVVTVGPLESLELTVGDSLTVEIPLTIARGYHVNANPAASDDYIPLEIVLTDSAGLSIGAAIYPPSKLWRLEGSTEDLKVYEGRVSVRLPLHCPINSQTGKRVLRGTVEFQACNDRICLLPDSRAFSLAVKIVSHQISR
jgi:uncharacterized protein